MLMPRLSRCSEPDPSPSIPTGLRRSAPRRAKHTRSVHWIPASVRSLCMRAYCAHQRRHNSIAAQSRPVELHWLPPLPNASSELHTAPRFSETGAPTFPAVFRGRSRARTAFSHHVGRSGVVRPPGYRTQENVLASSAVSAHLRTAVNAKHSPSPHHLPLLLTGPAPHLFFLVRLYKASH